MTGDGNLHVIGNVAAFEHVKFSEHMPGNRDRVGTGSFRYGESHSRLLWRLLRSRRSRAEEHILSRFLGCILDFGNFAQINRPAAEYTNNHVANIMRIRKESARLDAHFAV